VKFPHERGYDCKRVISSRGYPRYREGSLSLSQRTFHLIARNLLGFSAGIYAIEPNSKGFPCGPAGALRKGLKVKGFGSAKEEREAENFDQRRFSKIWGSRDLYP